MKLYQQRGLFMPYEQWDKILSSLKNYCLSSTSENSFTRSIIDVSGFKHLSFCVAANVLYFQRHS